jgi:hypothetical protein
VAFPSLHRTAALVAALAAVLAHAQDNPLARAAPVPAQLVNGRWNGVDLERRTHCSQPQNEGSRGTYAQFDLSTDLTGAFTIIQTGITGLNCTYGGHYTTAQDGSMAVTGTYSCTDGKQGTFTTRRIEATGITLTIQMGIQLAVTETCSIDGILSLARFNP